jgi:hypothetical protein
MALGFARDNNLLESQDPASAAGILNNLGGVGIADDIRLFAGNLSFEDEFDYGADAYTASANEFAENDEVFYTTGIPDSTFTYVVIPKTALGRVPYSNDTILYTLNSSSQRVYHIVGDSNGVDRFRLYEYSGGTKGPVRNWSSFYDLEVKKFFRPEPVYFENITNFSKDRVTLNDGTGGIINTWNNQENEEGLNAERDQSFEVTFLKSTTASEFATQVENSLDTLLYKKSRNLVSYKSNAFDRLIEFGGPVHIVNPNNIPLPTEANSFANNDIMPGLFIYGGEPPQVLRAFSDTRNPWVEDNSFTGSDNTSRAVIKTGVSNQSARVLNLIWKESPKILVTTTSGANQSTRTILNNVPVDAASNWTHKAKITVNGEDYYLLLTSNESLFEDPN